MKRFDISVDGLLGEDWPEQLRAMRDEGHQALVGLLERRREETDKTFAEWYEEELLSWGRSLYGHGPFAPATRLLQAMAEALLVSGVEQGQVQVKLDEFFGSRDLVARIPTLRIQCLLLAAQAHSVANGRRRPPNRGTINDVRMIGGTLPYADAIFIDNEMAEYLRQGPVQAQLGFTSRVFSQNTRDGLVAYLEEIRAAASAEHLATVEEVYGADWGQPFTGLYELD